MLRSPWVAIVCLVLMLALTGCIGGEDDPTATAPPAATATATEEPATATPEPTATLEPIPTSTPFRPAPTVSAPLPPPPTPTPTPTPTPSPEPEPTATATPEPEPTPTEESGGPGGPELVYSSDMTDWQAGELDFGRGFPSDQGYHMFHNGSDNEFLWNPMFAPVLSNLVASIDIRMQTPSTEAYGCLAIRIDPDDLAFAYTLCLTSQNQLVADFMYQSEFGYNFDVLVDFTSLGGTINSSAWNTLMIAAADSGFAFYLNGELVDSLAYDGPRSGVVGILVYGFGDEPTEWIFSDIEIWEVRE